MITVESFKFVGANFRGLSIFYRFVGLVGWGQRGKEGKGFKGKITPGNFFTRVIPKAEL